MTKIVLNTQTLDNVAIPCITNAKSGIENIKSKVSSIRVPGGFSFNPGEIVSALNDCNKDLISAIRWVEELKRRYNQDVLSTADSLKKISEKMVPRRQMILSKR